MKKKILFAAGCALTSFILYGCADNSANRQQLHSDPVTTDTLPGNPEDNWDQVDTDDSVPIPLTFNTGVATATGSKKAGERVAYSFESGNAKTAHIVLKPGIKDGNLRINNLTYPGGEGDGPFDRATDIRLTQQGKYIFVVAESHMNGEPYEGSFAVEVTLK